MIKEEPCLACGGSGKTLSGSPCSCYGGTIRTVVPDPPKPSPPRVKREVRQHNAGLNKRKPTEIETKVPRSHKSSLIKKSGPIAKPSKWNWKAGVVGFLVGTGVGTSQLGLEGSTALVLGGIAGIIFGYFYIQIIVIAIIAFIAYAVLKKP